MKSRLVMDPVIEAGVFNIADMASRCEKNSVTQLTEDTRKRFPIYGNVIFVYTNKDYTRLGLGDPKDVSNIAHIDI